MAERKRIYTIYGLNIPFIFKLILAVIIDGVDLLIGLGGLLNPLTPGISPGATVYDGLAGAGAVVLAGPMGVAAFWEVIAFTDIGNTGDAFAPSVTAVVVISEIVRRRREPRCPEGQEWNQEAEKCVKLLKD